MFLFSFLGIDGMLPVDLLVATTGSTLLATSESIPTTISPCVPKQDKVEPGSSEMELGSNYDNGMLLDFEMKGF